MGQRPYIGPDPERFFADRKITPNELIDLQVEVLDALEAAGHPEFAAADSDRALRDNATDSERKAWLAIYGPMTNVQV